MRGLIWLIPLLYGCSFPAVRCDTHLLPINPPAAGMPAASALKAGAAEAKAVDVRSIP